MQCAVKVPQKQLELSSAVDLLPFCTEDKTKKAADMMRQPATCDRTASAHVMVATATGCPAGRHAREAACPPDTLSLSCHSSLR